MVKTRNGPKLNGRKALQTLQPSVGDERVLVGQGGSVQLKKNLPPASAPLVSKVDVKSCQSMPDCESSPKIARRSQRKRGEIVSSSALRENVIPKPATAKARNSKNENSLKTAKVKSVKTKSKSVKTNKSKSKKLASKNDSLVQSTIEFPKSPTDRPVQSENVSMGSDLSYLMTDDAPEHYWRELAEQRQRALNETLRENESLRDQLAVLLAENTSLTRLVRSIGQFIEFAKQSLESEDEG